MSTQSQDEREPVELSEDDVVFLLSVLREQARPQPITTQDLIEALRARGGRS